MSATLYGFKNKTGIETLRRITFPPRNDALIISPAFALLTQHSLVHGIYSRDQNNPSSPILPSVHRKKFRKGLPMSSDTYSAPVISSFSELGIADNATEHSCKRGGACFRIFLLREDRNNTRDIFGHNDINIHSFISDFVRRNLMRRQRIYNMYSQTVINAP